MACQPRNESGRAGAKGSRGCPSKLGRLVGRGRPPPELQGDASAHRARVLWWILAPNQERSDRALPLLRCERGFGAAHVGVLSGVGAAAPRSHRGNRMGPFAAGDLRGTVDERERGRAVTSFCEQVMLRKEAAERARVRSSHPERIDQLGQGALGPPLPPVWVKLRRW